MSKEKESSFIDEVGDFFLDLIMGDFSADQGKAAMIVGGAISLIPVVDQVMDVRDVSGMVFRISKVGPAKATKEDWMDAALAAFGCIPEVGSLFKTIVKPLRKLRKEAGPLAGGNVMIEAMLAKSKGAAIKFMKTFDWAQNTQLAIVSAIAALDSCVAMLDELSQEHWWLSQELQYTARDMKPQVEALRGPLKSGITQGSAALQGMIRDWLGEDALIVAQNVAYAATVVGNPAAKHNQTPGVSLRNRSSASRSSAKKAAASSPTPSLEHKSQGASHTQVAKEGSGGLQNAVRTVEQAIEQVSKIYRGLIGEHIADYYHMERHLKRPGAWPHGDITGDWAAPYPRIVEKDGLSSRPKELIPMDAKKVTITGLDTVWHAASNEYHFVEAKLSGSGGAIFGAGKKKINSSTGRTLPPPPESLTSRQQVLWYLLSEPEKGTQMSESWLRRGGLKADMTAAIHMKNRWVYLCLVFPTTGKPFGERRRAGEKPLLLLPAEGVGDHILAMERLTETGRYGDLEIHDEHKPVHGVSDVFDAADIDEISNHRELQRLPKPTQSPSPEPSSPQQPAEKKPGKKQKRG